MAIQELSELALDVLEKLDRFGGAFAENEFDPSALNELRERGYVRGYKGGRIGINTTGELHLQRLKNSGVLGKVKLFAGAPSAPSTNGHASQYMPMEVERVHQTLDELGVPRTFYGSPLTADGRLRALMDHMNANAKAGAVAKILRTPGFEKEQGA